MGVFVDDKDDIFLSTRALLYIQCFVMDDLISYNGCCLHPIKWRSGKFDLRIGRRLRARKEQSGLSPFAYEDDHPEAILLIVISKRHEIIILLLILCKTH